MEQCKRARTEAKRMFTRAASTLKSAVESDCPVQSTIERRFSELKIRWDTVQSAHESYVSCLDGLTEQDTEKEDIWVDELLHTFCNLEEMMDHCLLKLSDIKSSSDKGSSLIKSHSESNTSIVQLERIKIRCFGGDIRRYPKFREDFIKHIKPLCSISQLPLVLRTHLTDDVCDEVENVEDSFDAILQRLYQKY